MLPYGKQKIDQTDITAVIKSLKKKISNGIILKN